MSSSNKNETVISFSESTKSADKNTTNIKANSSGSSAIFNTSSSSAVNKAQNTFVPAISLFGKVNNVLTNDPEGYYNKESDKVYELLSSSLEVYMRNIIKKMYDNRTNRLKKITKVLNGQPSNMGKISKVIETLDKEDRKLELQRIKSRKENGIDVTDEDIVDDEADETAPQKQGNAKDAGIGSLSSTAGGSSSVAGLVNKNAASSDNNSTANLFSGGMNKKYSWLSGGASSTNLKTSKSSSILNNIGSLSGNPFSKNENALVQTDIRNHVVKEEKNLVMRDLIKVLEWELQNNSKSFSNKDIQEILAKGYARLRD